MVQRLWEGVLFPKTPKIDYIKARLSQRLSVANLTSVLSGPLSLRALDWSTELSLKIV